MRISRTLPAAFALLALAASGHARPSADQRHWAYAGRHGPSQWHRLDPDFAPCKAGRQASPVALGGAIGADLPALRLDARTLPFRVHDTEHALQADAAGTATFTYDRQTYSLAQFHFHHPAEHYVGVPGVTGELHLVHKLADGRLGVIGVPIREGVANPAVQAVLDALATHHTAPIDLALRDLLPRRRAVQAAYFRYEGSLTTPPCSETVDWFVLADPIAVSPAQMARIRALHGRNARPLQALNRRFVLRSRAGR